MNKDVTRVTPILIGVTRVTRVVTRVTRVILMELRSVVHHYLRKLTRVTRVKYWDAN
jgi:hypothetical protein